MFTTTIYGGVGYGGQLNALRKGVDIVVACPGRLVDHMDSRNVDFSDVEITVLDEADHMAELGFLQHVEQILAATPRGTQRLLFSATLDRGIDRLVDKFLNSPITHEVDPADSPVDAMSHHVLHIDQSDRVGILKDLCAAPGKTLVFTRTKHGAARLTEQLMKAGVPSVELHGNLSQSARARNLAAFAAGRADTLVATDIAARGIHVDDVSLVIHADPPEEHKAYLHRSGRTARAGASGTVVTLMTDKQRRSVRALAKQAGITPTTTKVAPNHPFLNELAPGDRVFVETSSIDMHPAPERKPGGPRKGGPKRQFTAGHKPSGPKSHGDRSHNDRSQNNSGRPSAGKQRNKYRGNRKAR
jgi:superfamily II DNA/RNA helicase